MLNAIVAVVLRQRVLVLAGAVLLLLLGARAATTIPLDVFPEFALPRVEVQTEAPGLSAEEVEQLVTLPLEQAFNGAPWVQTLRSKSVAGLSSVVCYFDEGTDLIRARQLISERVAVVSANLAGVVRPPVILPPVSSTNRALKIGMSAPGLDALALTDLAVSTVRPRLLAVPGVANVAVWGQRNREYQVLVDPDRLAARGVTIDDVRRAAGGATVVTGGGYVDTPNQRLPIRHLAAVLTPDDLARSLMRFEDGAPLRLGDVADVVEGHPPPIGDAVVDDGPGLLLVVEKHPWSNTLDVTRGVEAALERLRPALGGVTLDPTIFRPATFIEQSLGNLSRALILGCALVMLVLIAFTRDWRSAMVSFAAVPVSLLVACALLALRGGTLNTMAIAGLIIALGEIVDDAIVGVENARRRLRENRDAAVALPAVEVVRAATLEVRSAVFVAGLIVALVFLPVLAMPGLAGALFRPLATSYLIAVGASMLVALTLTPVLCLLLLPGEPRERKEPPFLTRLKTRYGEMLSRFLQRPRHCAAALVVLLLAAGTGAMSLDDEFLPQFRERDFLMHWIEKPGTSLDAMRRITIRASRELRAIPGVRSFGAHIGRAEAADEVVGPNFAENWLSIDAEAPYDETVARIRSVAAGYPGLYRDVLTYLRERVKEVLAGAGASIVVRVYGSDLDQLRVEAERVREAIADVPGIVDLHVESQVLVPEVQVSLNAERAASLGLNAAAVRQAVALLIQGERVGQVHLGQRVIDVTIRGTDGVRSSVEALRGAQLETPLGARVPLSDVADVAVAPAVNEVRHEGGSRRIDVTADAGRGDLGRVAREIERRVGAMAFARGYHPEVLGEYQALRETRTGLATVGVLCVAAMLLLLYVDFQSSRLTLLVAASLPFALVGGVAGAWLATGSLSLGSLVGFITVLGIASRNGLLLVSHYRHLERVEGVSFGPGLVLRGAQERLTPILMTATCAALALLPIVFSGDAPGHEIEAPMAAVILGGLVTSTALTLLLLPSLYLAYGFPRRSRLQPVHESAPGTGHRAVS